MRWHTAKSNAFATNKILCGPFYKAGQFRSYYYCQMFASGEPCSDCLVDIHVFGETNNVA